MESTARSPWQSAKLKEVARIERDALQPQEIVAGTKYLGLEHIESGGKILNAQSVARGDLASSKFKFTGQHLLYGKLRPYLAKIARPDFSGICSTDILPILPGAKLDRDFLCYYLRQPSMVDYANSRATGANLPRLSPTALADFELPLPPIEEQRRIAAILDKADELRATRRSALAELDPLTQSIFLEMFGDPATATDRFPIQPLESLLGQPLQNGAYYPKDAYTQDGGVEMVHMSDAFYEVVPRGNLKRVICAKPDVQKYALTELDILVARRSLTLEGAAKPCLIPKSDEPLIFESSFIRVTPHPDKITALYLYHYLANERIKRKRVQPYITQSTISGINQSNLARVLITCPPLNLQQDFACRAAAIESLKAKHRAALAELGTLFASLQHRAFRGEL